MSHTHPAVDRFLDGDIGVWCVSTDGDIRQSVQVVEAILVLTVNTEGNLPTCASCFYMVKI